MKRGLVIGKFLPLHNGHISLINFAKERCDELVVFAHKGAEDCIDVTVRLGWLYKVFGGDKSITIETNDTLLPESSVPSKDISKVWADYLIKRFPDVNVLFSSEKYGEYVSGYMEIENVVYDIDRNIAPISATAIRKNPYENWFFLPDVVKPYYFKKVCVYGPESAGKTTLTKKLADWYHTDFVPEMAVVYLGERHVVYEDIEKIYVLQAEEVLKKSKTTEKILFCDTDLFTTKIYSEHYFGKYPKIPKWVEATHNYDHYLFCDIDVPWVPHVQRDSQNFREVHRRQFMKELTDRNIDFTLITGDWDNRFQTAVGALKYKFGI